MEKWLRFVNMVLALSLLIFLSPLDQTSKLPEAYDADLQNLPVDRTLAHLGLPKPLARANLQYQPHEPIQITNNADFAAFGFPGTGTEENPYLIEGLNITRYGGSYEILIDIDDTTAYFCIRNNVLTGVPRTYVGIALGNVIHGTVDSNIINNSYWGILIYSADNNTITRNTISDCEYDGIYGYGKNNHVTDNTIFDCKKAGITLEDANSRLVHNTIFNCTEAGIKVEYSRLTVVANNTISDCGRGIALMDESKQITVSDNGISKCGVGLYIYASSQNTVIRNQLDNTGGLVIELWLKPDWSIIPFIGTIENYLQATVTENKVNNRPLVFWQDVQGGRVPAGAGQVVLLNCTGVEVTKATISQVVNGVFTAFCSNLNIYSNIVTNCSKDGIALYESRNSTVTHNTVINCGAGIKLNKGRQNTISNNTVSDCGAGIQIHQSPQNTLVRNQLTTADLVLTGLSEVLRAGFTVTPVKDILQATVKENMVNDRPLVFWQNVRGGRVPAGAGQVVLLNCTGVEVTKGNISRVAIGVFLAFCENVTIHHNTIANCTYGIELHLSHNTNVTYNTIAHNWGYGIILESYTPYFGRPPAPYGPIPMNNTVMWNDFRGNNVGRGAQAYDTGLNTVFAYNYWDDHRSTDQNGDRVADTPYSIDPQRFNRDPSPLMVSVFSHHLSPPTLIEPKSRETLQGTVKIRWLAANDSWEHPITYTVLYSPDAGQTWISLASDLSTLEYEWDTTTVADGSVYWLQIVATCSNGLTAKDVSARSFTIQNPKTTTSVPETQNGMVPIIFVSLVLIIASLIRVKRRQSYRLQNLHRS
ncbi:MAG: right-handed parallel beta-helix repeat-containing protein [Candidatus Heimdallarchaeota archaeon]